MDLSRRDVLGTGVVLLAGHATRAVASAQEATKGYGAALTGQGITSGLARFISRIRYEDLPPSAVHEAKRAVLDWTGCALAGRTHPTTKTLLGTLEELGSRPAATVIGHRGRLLSLLDAPVVNGQMGHVLDFDDTHLGGVILHTSTAALPALFALGERRRATGRDVIAALAAAFEAGIRAGQAAPNHHLGGWHLTGTLGTIAAAAAAARLTGLNPEQATFALGIACTQAAGMQQNRGSDCKSLHAGKSAYHGVLAATLAANGFNSSSEILEGNLGFTKVYSTKQKNDAMLANLGRPWLITGNGYKPYACGVVLHPLIDAMIGVARKADRPAADITKVEVLVHPDVIRITGIDTPNSGLMSKFSANHAAAVAYLDRAAGVAQFTNERSADPAVLALRRLIQVKPSSSFRLDQSSAVAHTRTGAPVTVHIDHATGTVSNPMSDEALLQKFMGNASPVVGADRARQLADMAWALDRLDDVSSLVRACA